MAKAEHSIFWIWILALMVLSSPLLSQEDPDALERDLEALRSEITLIQARLDERFSQRDTLTAELAQSEQALSVALGEQRRTQLRITTTTDRIAVIRADIDQAAAAISEVSERLSEQLSLVYRQGMPSQLQMLLNQQDPRQLRRNLAYHGHLSRQRLALIEELSRVKSELEQSRQELALENAELAALHEQQLEEVQRVQTERARRDRALGQINAQITADTQRIARLEADAEQLASLIEELRRALEDIAMEADVPSILTLAGELAPPVAGRVLQAFGDHRGGELRWTGWLLEAPGGTEIRSIAHGRVAFADWLRGYGMLIILDHGDGIMSLYGHNETLLRSVGNWVSPGDVIATAGQSGGADREGLYFEIRQDGQPVDPARWVAR
ncbi:MAG: peptidoglycan DD-metalloendopeptidase family protein [Wenzhouxiangella sp.]|jgi:septal ring factor EnvC (AmiA/AmiB activator)|nr:peptidoglycan DD-metalloendopeptidase family protein [Wenzhouxiangella sp.]